MQAEAERTLIFVWLRSFTPVVFSQRDKSQKTHISNIVIIFRIGHTNALWMGRSRDHENETGVLVQREVEQRRSPLVSIPPLRAGIFKAFGSADPMCFGEGAKCEVPRP
jgi:hypothetical protein